MLRIFAACLLGLMVNVTGVLALEADTPLIDSGLEVRAQSIAHSLRCLVCQNQSIADSDAPLAKDLRAIVRERLQAGDSDEKIRGYLVARYGDWVLLQPPLRQNTWLLWFGPLALLIFGAMGVGGYFWRQRQHVSSMVNAPLQAEEAARLQKLLHEP